MATEPAVRVLLPPKKKTFYYLQTYIPRDIIHKLISSSLRNHLMLLDLGREGGMGVALPIDDTDQQTLLPLHEPALHTSTEIHHCLLRMNDPFLLSR